MQVKRYCCADVREALRLIRAELGPDAVVIGTRERPDLPGGRNGRPLIEVTAAVDPEGNAPAADEPRGGRDGLDWLVDVLSEDGLDRQLAGLVVAEAAQMVPEELATTARLRAAVAVVLRRRTRVAPPPWAPDDDGKSERIAWFVGPAGVGKTTVVAKVAAFAAWQERQRVAVIALDTARPGATARLAALTKAMDVPFHEATGALALRETIARLKDVDRVLIDTAPPSAGTTIDSLGALVAAAPGRTYLCVAADTATRSALATVGRWSALGIDALIATRVDEAATLGAAFAAHQALRRPLALLSTGPTVPDDIEVARPDAVCRRILVSTPDGGAGGPGRPRDDEARARTTTTGANRREQTAATEEGRQGPRAGHRDGTRDGTRDETREGHRDGRARYVA